MIYLSKTSAGKSNLFIRSSSAYKGVKSALDSCMEKWDAHDFMRFSACPSGVQRECRSPVGTCGTSINKGNFGDALHIYTFVVRLD